MMDKKQQMLDTAASYGIGGFGIGWGSFAAFADQLTSIFGMVSAFLGMLVVGIKLYFDIRRAFKGKRKK